MRAVSCSKRNALVRCLTVCLSVCALGHILKVTRQWAAPKWPVCIRALRCRYVCRILRRACLSVCLSASTSPQLHGQNWRGSVSSGGIAIWFMDDSMFLLIMARNRRRKKGVYAQSDSTGGSMDTTPRRVLKLAHQGQHRTGGGI